MRGNKLSANSEFYLGGKNLCKTVSNKTKTTISKLEPLKWLYLTLYTSWGCSWALQANRKQRGFGAPTPHPPLISSSPPSLWCPKLDSQHHWASKGYTKYVFIVRTPGEIQQVGINATFGAAMYRHFWKRWQPFVIGRLWASRAQGMSFIFYDWWQQRTVAVGKLFD